MCSLRVAGEMDKVYEKKYTRAIADIKYLKLDQEQKILDIRDQHKAELDEMKEKMKAMEEAYRVQLDERNSELVELEDRLSTYFQANKPLKRLAECESALEKAQEEIEVLRTQKEVADEIGIVDYKVCKCVNDDDKFIEAIKDITKLS